MPTTARQIPFDLGHRTALGREDFFVSPANARAVEWVDRWPDWPAPFAIVQGPPGCGKSHLCAVWARRSGALFIDPCTLADAGAEAAGALAPGRPVVIDPLDPVLGSRAAETAVFHLYNLFKEQNRTALTTLRLPPAQCAFALPDLASRLRAAPLAAIAEPDDALLAAVLLKLFGDRQIAVGHEALHYALSRMERSFEAARALVDAADRLALAEKRPVTAPLLRRMMEGRDSDGAA